MPDTNTNTDKNSQPDAESSVTRANKWKLSKAAKRRLRDRAVVRQRDAKKAEAEGLVAGTLSRSRGRPKEKTTSATAIDQRPPSPTYRDVLMRPASPHSRANNETNFTTENDTVSMKDLTRPTARIANKNGMISPIATSMSPTTHNVRSPSHTTTATEPYTAPNVNIGNICSTTTIGTALDIDIGATTPRPSTHTTSTTVPYIVPDIGTNTVTETTALYLDIARNINISTTTPGPSAIPTTNETNVNNPAHPIPTCSIPLSSPFAQPSSTTAPFNISVPSLPPLQSTMPSPYNKPLSSPFVQMKFNNQIVDFSVPSFTDPVNEDAFYYYQPNKHGGRHRADVNKNNLNYNIQQNSDKQKNREKSRIVDVILSVGNINQQRLALREALSDPKIRDVASSLGFNTVEAAAGISLIRNMKKVLDQTKNNKNKYANPTESRQTVANALMLTVVSTPDNATSKAGNNIRNASVALGMSPRSIYRKASTAAQKRKQMRNDDDAGFTMMTKKAKKSKYSNEFIDKMRQWMVNNRFVIDSPNKNNVVIMRDANGKNNMIDLFIILYIATLTIQISCNCF